MKLSISLFLFFFYSTIFTQPINDSPCLGNENPPYNLGFEGSHSGTTCEAIGYNDDQNADQQNVDCNSSTDDNSVWYRADFDSDYDGVNINITKGTIGQNVGVEVYVGGEDAICDGTAEFRKSKCNGLPVIEMHIGCIEDGQFVFIKVTSTDGDCGTFNISVEQIVDCDVADNCENITAAQTLWPVTNLDGGFDYVCLNGCLDLACPENPNPPGCDFTQNPTVWFQVNVDVEATQLYSSVTTSGSWTPIWSVFYPDPDCAELSNIAGSGSIPCSADAFPPAPPFISGVTEGTYYIAVTADPNGEPIDDPSLEICVATIINVVVCLGPDIGCAPEESLIFEITDREHSYIEPNGSPFLGPFYPGEELTVRIIFNYDATQTGNDWLIGVIPKFGSGWDDDGFDWNSYAPVGNGRTSEWYEENSDCAPFVMENYPYLCTYIDDDGKLKLCNQLCEICPCSGGMERPDPLPSGYFWVVEGGSPDCSSTECSPSYKYGITNPVANITWNFTMKVKEFDSQEMVLDNNDLGISFMTFSDGGAGCWDDPVGECLIDKPQFSPSWKVFYNLDTNTVYASETYLEICSGDAIDIHFTTDDTSKRKIEVINNNNSNVLGVNEYLFENGSGTINDVLFLSNMDTCDFEIVEYYYGLKDTITNSTVAYEKVTVKVLPRPIFENNKVSLFRCKYDVLKVDLKNYMSFCGNAFDYYWEYLDSTLNISDSSSIITLDSNFITGTYTFNTNVSSQYGCNVYDQFEITIVDSQNSDSTFIFEIIDREFKNLEPNGSPYQGPFLPSEKLSVHLSFDYLADEVNNDWLMGVFPKFGNGWDITILDSINSVPRSHNKKSKLYSVDGDCPAYITENVEQLCTYIDENGVLQICNTLCEDCPCDPGMKLYDSIPTGYFWAQEGGSTTCDTSNCSPAAKYGIGSSNVRISWNFDLRVKEFELAEDCFNQNDLQIIVNPLSDNIIGCWDDPFSDFTLSKTLFSPEWKVECSIDTNTVPELIVSDSFLEICTEDQLSIHLYTGFGTSFKTVVNAIDNPNVSGENDYIFDFGNGYIEDQLVINDPDFCDFEIVEYVCGIKLPGVDTLVNSDTIIVKVYPKPELLLDDEILVICTSSDTIIDLKENMKSCGDIFNYYWYMELNNSFYRSDSSSFIIIDSTYLHGIYKVNTFISNENICSSNAEFYITISENPNPDFNFSIDSFLVSFVNLSDTVSSFKWSFGDGEISYEFSPQHTYSEAGTYNVMLWEFKDCGNDSISRNVVIETTGIKNIEDINSPFIIPNPNTGEFQLMLGDFNKDKFYVELFSSTGQKVFFNSYSGIQNLKLIPFDFKLLPSGVYFLKIMDQDNSKVLKFVKE